MASLGSIFVFQGLFQKRKNGIFHCNDRVHRTPFQSSRGGVFYFPICTPILARPIMSLFRHISVR